MDKEKLLLMFTKYVAYKENVIKAHTDYLNDPTDEKEDIWMNLVLEDDDRWQEIVNYVYQED